MKKYNVNEYNESQAGCANVGQTTAYNQVDDLKSENDMLKNSIAEHKEELLQVYRRLHNQGY